MSSPSLHHEWLGFVRVLFGLTFLIGFPRSSNLGVEALPNTLFFPPIGPFALAPGYPSVTVIATIELLLTITTVSLTMGLWTKFSSWLFALLFTAASGIQYSTGKIDHDFIVAMVPLVLAPIWGRSFALLPDRAELTDDSLWKRLDTLSVAIGAFWISSGVIKALTGWMPLRMGEGNPFLEWLQFYVNNYNLELLPFATFFLDPTIGQISGAFTVVLELAIGLGFISQKYRILALGLALAAHVAIALVFQILFFKLIPIYLSVLKPPNHETSLALGRISGARLWKVSAASLVMITVISAFVLGPVVAWTLLLAGAGALYLGSKVQTREYSGGLKTRTKSTLLAVFLLPTLITAIWNIELYPVIQGPIFRGGFDGNQCLTVVETPREASKLGHVQFTNLKFIAFARKGYQGHENQSAINFSLGLDPNDLGYVGLWESCSPDDGGR